MERCIYNHVYEHVSPRLTPFQHGFVKGKSCATQLLEVYHQIGERLDHASQTDILFLDLSKAFDSVSHTLLMHKLQSFGINCKLLEWLRSYLSNRRQRVVLEGESSEWLPVKSVVPQGSILGPLMFLLFINDMPSVVSSGLVSLFADDAKCFHPINNIGDCLALHGDLDRLYDWSVKWRLVFNIEKCKVLTVSRSRTPVNFNYSINGSVLEKVDSFTDLGVTVSHDLSWGHHISSIISKCNQTLGMVKRSIGFKAQSSLKSKLYQSLVRSKLESVFWSPHLHSHIKSLVTIQRSLPLDTL